MELKRCPFCGGDVEFIRDDLGHGYMITCCVCNINFGTFDDFGVFKTKKEAIEAWNRRTK